MREYEFVDPDTGEMRSLQTNIDIDLIKQYNEWVIESKLNPPQYTPVEFAEHMETIKKLKALEAAITVLEDVGVEQVDSKIILRILRNEE